MAPIEETISGTVVVPWARFGDIEVRELRLEFLRGRVSELSAREGGEAVRAALEGSPALEHFREFGLGFNPRLVVPMGQRWLPYYGYGAGVVRLSLGNNFEVGGQVGGIGTRWFFFPDATVEVAGTALVVGGELVIPPSSLDARVVEAISALRPRLNAFTGLAALERLRGTPSARGRVVFVYGDVVTIELSPDSPAIEAPEAMLAVYAGDQYKGEVVVAAIRDRTLFCLTAIAIDDASMTVGDGAAVLSREMD